LQKISSCQNEEILLISYNGEPDDSISFTIGLKWFGFLFAEICFKFPFLSTTTEFLTLLTVGQFFTTYFQNKNAFSKENEGIKSDILWQRNRNYKHFTQAPFSPELTRSHISIPREKTPPN